jgi:GNAT superfamily N-acetyltransferase
MDEMVVLDESIISLEDVPAGGVARETGEAAARTDAGPWTQKLLDVDARRQADIDAGKSFEEMSYGEQLVDLDRYAEKIEVPDPTYGPLGEITINYNHPSYRRHGELVAEVSWGPKEPFGAGLFEKTPLQQAPMGERAGWARAVLRKVKQVVDEMTAEGITVVAEVQADRRSLIRLYENAGFVRVPRESMRSQVGREGMVEMVRRPVPAG